MVSEDGTRPLALTIGAVGSRSEPDRAGDGAHPCEHHRCNDQRERRPSHPGRSISSRDLDDDRRGGCEHGRGDQPVHRPGGGRDPAVVAGDRREHVVRQVALTMAQHLDVEHQVEPQDGEQEAGPGGHERGHASESDSQVPGE